MIREIKRTCNKVLAESSQSNRIKGQLATFATGVLLLLSNSDLLENYPIAKSITTMLAGALASKARTHAMKTK